MAKPKLTPEAHYVLDQAALALLMGKRLLVKDPGGRPIYLGESARPPVGAPGPYWYEHPGGRTYMATPIGVVMAVLPHVGVAQFVSAVRNPLSGV